MWAMISVAMSNSSAIGCGRNGTTRGTKNNLYRWYQHIWPDGERDGELPEAEHRKVVQWLKETKIGDLPGSYGMRCMNKRVARALIEVYDMWWFRPLLD